MYPHDQRATVILICYEFYIFVKFKRESLIIGRVKSEPLISSVLIEH